MRVLGLLFAFLLLPSALPSQEDAPRPNLLLIMADDLGFSDLGCYGGEIRTPVLDALANQGLRFTQFYNTGRCWPTRTALLTGYYPQQVGRDAIPGKYQGGGRGVRPKWAPLLPTMLDGAGYRSYHVGKWHLDGMPCVGGFDRSYYMRDQHRFFSPETRYLDDHKLPRVQRDEDFYATTSLADYAVEFLEEHESQHADSPFFLYLAFAAPHFPLHALPEDIAAYEGAYDEGWNEVRKKRWNQLRQRGLLPKRSSLSEVDAEVGPPYHFPDDLKKLGPDEVNRPVPWNTLTESQKRFQAKKMEIHAAMITCMDREIGRVLDQMRSMGAYEDTLVMFLSDNGASAEIMVRADGHDPTAPMGSAASHLCLGPGWSTVANTPFRMHKTWTHEGGTCTPFVVHWPSGIGSDRAGTLVRSPQHIVDVVPTLLGLAGTAQNRGDDRPDFPGQVIRRIAGSDAGGETEDRTLWWAHDGHRAVRVGDWKLVSRKGRAWELYDLARDRSETSDLASEHPERVGRLEAAWNDLAEEFLSVAPEVKARSGSARDREKAQQQKR